MVASIIVVANLDNNKKDSSRWSYANICRFKPIRRKNEVVCALLKPIELHTNVVVFLDLFAQRLR